MGLRARIVRRWNRRDVVAVLVIGVTVAFVTGTTLLVIAATSQTTDVAREFDRVGDVTTVASMDEATERAGPDAVVLPLARITDATGGERSDGDIPEGTGGRSKR